MHKYSCKPSNRIKSFLISSNLWKASSLFWIFFFEKEKIEQMMMHILLHVHVYYLSHYKGLSVFSKTWFLAALLRAIKSNVNEFDISIPLAFLSPFCMYIVCLWFCILFSTDYSWIWIDIVRKTGSRWNYTVKKVIENKCTQLFPSRLQHPSPKSSIIFSGIWQYIHPIFFFYVSF
jgi:hypothetical protein